MPRAQAFELAQQGNWRGHAALARWQALDELERYQRPPLESDVALARLIRGDLMPQSELRDRIVYARHVSVRCVEALCGFFARCRGRR